MLLNLFPLDELGHIVVELEVGELGVECGEANCKSLERVEWVLQNSNDGGVREITVLS